MKIVGKQLHFTCPDAVLILAGYAGKDPDENGDAHDQHENNDHVRGTEIFLESLRVLKNFFYAVRH